MYAIKVLKTQPETNLHFEGEVDKERFPSRGMLSELRLVKGICAISSNATAIADVGCQRYSSKCKFTSKDPAGRSTLPTDLAASVLLYTQISKENSIDVNDRYPRCCCGSRGAVGQDALRQGRPFHRHRELRESLVAMRTKQMTIRVKRALQKH